MFLVNNPSTESARYCLDCGYPVLGLSEDRCPECGRAFDPTDSRTTSHRSSPSIWPTLDTVLRVMCVGAGILTGVVFVVSWLGTDLLVLWLVGFLAIPFAFPLILLAATPSVRSTRRTRVLSVVWIVLFFSIVTTGWPLSIWFLAHRPALDRYVNRIRAGELPTSSGPVLIGAMRFREIRMEEDNIGFQASGGGGGGIYFVHTVPTSTRVWVNTNWEQTLGGGWYRVYED